jgi:hypothetical protein
VPEYEGDKEDRNHYTKDNSQNIRAPHRPILAPLIGGSVSLMLLPVVSPLLTTTSAEFLKFVSGRGAVRVVYYMSNGIHGLVRAFFGQQASPVMGIQTPCEML